MMPKIDKPAPPPATPTRADASVITAGLGEAPRGFSAVTNSAIGALARRARTGKTVNTGGTSQ